MNQNNALFIHRSIDAANFAVTTTVQARNAAALSQPIGDGYHYAGPMIRLPTSDTPGGAQNFAFIGVGYQSGCNGATTQCIEAKSTQNSAATILRCGETAFLACASTRRSRATTCVSTICAAEPAVV